MYVSAKIRPWTYDKIRESPCAKDEPWHFIPVFASNAVPGPAVVIPNMVFTRGSTPRRAMC